MENFFSASEKTKKAVWRYPNYTMSVVGFIFGTIAGAYLFQQYARCMITYASNVRAGSVPLRDAAMTLVIASANQLINAETLWSSILAVSDMMHAVLCSVYIVYFYDDILYDEFTWALPFFMFPLSSIRQTLAYMDQDG